MTFGAPLMVRLGDSVSPERNGLLRGTVPFPRGVLARNVEDAMARNLPRFFGSSVRLKDGAGHVKWQREPIAIIGGGPSLKDTIEEARKFKVTMVCGSAHDYVIEAGIIPTYVAIVDPAVVNVDNVDWHKFPQESTTYLIASQCDPSMFDRLRGCRVELWHASGGVEDFGDEPSIGGGCTIGLRATELGLLLGYWDQHFFGFDSSYRDGDHAYYAWPPHPNRATARVNDREFQTDLSMLAQAEHFINQFRDRKQIMRATIHGDGLLAEMVRCANGQHGIHLA